MNFSVLDWVIFIGLFVLLTSMSFFLKKFAKGVAGFLVAGRNVGRYLGLESDSMAGLGAITILATWQLTYESGFVGNLWFLLKPLAATVVALTGFGIYRFRQTRAMTLGQFVEARYSKSARITFGLIAYAAGVLNMGIFPSVGSRFFVHYCGFPAEIAIGSQAIPMYVILMLVMLVSAVIICFNGGQVTLVVTNFVQALIVNIMLVVIMITIYKTFTWDQVSEAFLNASNADDLLQPFTAKSATEFNKFFFLISVFWMVYWVISWSPNTMVTSSASDAHEAKMMRVMVEIKKIVYLGLGIGILPLAVFVIMHHPDFTVQAASVTESLSHIENEYLRSVMTTPAALQFIIPRGLLGAFAGFVLFAFLSTHTSYLLAWGGMLIQDVVLPIRGKKLEAKQHMMWIRVSIVFVAIFIFLFSAYYPLNDNIWMFLDLTAGLYLAGCSVILLGGLYFKRGTTAAAFTSMAVGVVLTVIGFLYRLKNPDFLNGTILSFYITGICVFLYFAISFMSKHPNVNLNELLNRRPEEVEARKKLRWYQFGPEVPKGDRILISAFLGAIIAFVIAFVATWVYNSHHDIATESWLSFWKKYVYVMFWLGTAFMVWVVTGGFRNLVQMFKNIKSQEADDADDGSVM